MIPSTPPKGSLEELFRHHLLESEASAVRPRPQVWEQIDNNLLLAQNENYRRRLLAYRWAMAASLLLASLAGGGWWRSQHGATPTTTLAHATTQPANQPSVLVARQAAASAAGPGISQPLATTLGAAIQPTASSSSTTNLLAIDPTATFSTSAHGGIADAFHFSSGRAAHIASPGHGRAYSEGWLAGANSSALMQQLASSSPATSERVASALAASAGSLALASPERLPAAASSVVSAAATEARLATRWASLAPAPNVPLPNTLNEVAVAPGPPLELSRHWQYGVAYTTSAFQPNIDWVKPVAAYSTTLGVSSIMLTRSAASEYRDNLRPGLGQRLSFWASRRLGNGRWSLRTGLEVAQNTATSASSAAFVGEPVADVTSNSALSYTQPSPHQLRRTSYRYRSVSVPAELRYSNPLKTGFSLYGRMGAFVSALLNARGEVEGSPEATRTYTLQSAASPYRHVSGGLRAGAGLQYRPAGHQWSLNIGPVAEMGILSLNADPSQDFWSQQRPYSFGLEAGVELGRGFRLQ